MTNTPTTAIADKSLQKQSTIRKKKRGDLPYYTHAPASLVKERGWPNMLQFDAVRYRLGCSCKGERLICAICESVKGPFSCDIRTASGRIQGINFRFCTPIHHSDGYSYQKGASHSSLD